LKEKYRKVRVAAHRRVLSCKPTGRREEVSALLLFYMRGGGGSLILEKGQERVE